MCGRSVMHLALAAVAALLLLNGCGQPAPSATVASSAAAQSGSAATATPPPTSDTSTTSTSVAPSPAAPSPTTAPPTVTPPPTLAPSPTSAPTASTASAATTALDRAAVARGKAVFTSAGCALCHTIQGVSNGNQCPNLTHIASVPIASPPWDNLPNDPAFLRRWIKNPQAIKPGNLMPNLGLTDQQVDDVVAFLETQR